MSGASKVTGGPPRRVFPGSGAVLGLPFPFLRLSRRLRGGRLRARRGWRWRNPSLAWGLGAVFGCGACLRMRRRPVHDLRPLPSRVSRASLVPPWMLPTAPCGRMFADDGLERVQAEPAPRGWHLVGEVQPQHLAVPARVVVGHVGAPLRRPCQLAAPQVPAHGRRPGLRLLRRSPAPRHTDTHRPTHTDTHARTPRFCRRTPGWRHSSVPEVVACLQPGTFSAGGGFFFFFFAKSRKFPPLK